MSELTVGERHDLVAHFVDGAQLNWAHICMAQLMKHGFVDRILTTNFDLLVVRGCALVNEFPAVYDFAASQALIPSDIPSRAVFYLHGQRTGFVLLNTAAETETHASKLSPLFEDAGRGRVWIVVGYSGENDPVFEQLAAVPRFQNGLFWVGFGSRPPPPHVAKLLLSCGKDAYFVQGYDSDSFLIELAQRLRIFPPDFVSLPFTHLEGLLRGLSRFPLSQSASGSAGEPSGARESIDVTQVALSWVSEAKAKYESREASQAASHPAHTRVRAEEARATSLLDLQQKLLAGDYQGIVKLRGEYDSRPPDPEFAALFSAAYVRLGERRVREESTGKYSGDPVRLKEAEDAYRAALALSPDSIPALLGLARAILGRAAQAAEKADALLVDDAIAIGLAKNLSRQERLAFRKDLAGVFLESSLLLKPRLARRLLEVASEYLHAVPERKPVLKIEGMWLVRVLQELAATQPPELAHATLAEVTALLRKMAAEDPDDFMARFWLESVLADLARFEPPDRAIILLEETVTICRKEVAAPSGQIADRLYLALALGQLSGLRRGQRGLKLMQEALTLSDQILLADPRSVACKMLHAVLGLRRLRYGYAPNTASALRDLKMEYMNLEVGPPALGAMGLAIIAAIEGNEHECQQWLDRMEASNSARPVYEVKQIPEFSQYHNKDWFRNLCTRIGL